MGAALVKHSMKGRKTDMSRTPVTPATSASSIGSGSTQPSTPVEDIMDQQRRNGESAGSGEPKQEEEEDDLEGMDVKAKGLMHLLRTSSVRIRRDGL